VKRALFSAGLALALVGAGSSVAWADVATVPEQNLTEIVELQPGVSAEEMAEAGLPEGEMGTMSVGKGANKLPAATRKGDLFYTPNTIKTGHVGAKNCSKLVWSAYLLKSGLDIDSDKGAGVYPRDIRNSSYTVSYKTLKW
jgi:hypothetical protein